MTAMAIGTLLVDHATADWIEPTRSTSWSYPIAETARPTAPGSDAASRVKLARSALERIRRSSPPSALPRERVGAWPAAVFDGSPVWRRDTGRSSAPPAGAVWLFGRGDGGTACATVDSRRASWLPQ